MGKITKRQTKLHDQVMDLIHSDRSLSRDEVEFCFQNFNPLATHNIGKGAIYFTPFDLAWELAVMTQPKGAVIDLCAGIGGLSYQVLRHDYTGWMDRTELRGDIKRMVAIEQDTGFAEVGKRLLPEVEWYCGNVFDLDLLTSLGEFDCAIANPPYGNIPSKLQADWLKVKGPIQWQVIEIALRLAYNGAVMILPEGDCDDTYNYVPLPRSEKDIGTRPIGKQHGYRRDPERAKYLDKHFPGIHMHDLSIDTSMYEDQWIGAATKVLIVNIDVDDVDFERPYGFADVSRKLVNVPAVKPVKRPTLRQSEAKEEQGEQLSIL